MNVNWFYMPKYGAFSDKEKVTEKSPSGNLTQWIVKGFKRKGIKRVSRSVRAYIYKCRHLYASK